LNCRFTTALETQCEERSGHRKQRNAIYADLSVQTASNMAHIGALCGDELV